MENRSKRILDLENTLQIQRLFNAKIQELFLEEPQNSLKWNNLKISQKKKNQILAKIQNKNQRDFLLISKIERKAINL